MMIFQCGVVRIGEAWYLTYYGRRAGKYDSQHAAITCAMRLAEQARSHGHRVQVIVQGDYGSLSRVAIN